MDDLEFKEQAEVFSKVVRAGKRTYFFDVKSTQSNELYLAITESKKRYNDDGKYFYEKHKIYIYKEDFDKFVDNFNESINFIHSNQTNSEITSVTEKNNTEEPVMQEMNYNYSNLKFEDLGVTSNSSDKME